MCLGREGGEGVMVVECFDYSGTVRKVIYYWEPIKKYLADFFPKFASCFLTKSCHHFLAVQDSSIGDLVTHSVSE